MNERIETIASIVTGYTHVNLTDIPADQWTALPGGLKRHPASIVAHITATNGASASALGRPAELPAGFVERFAPAALADDEVGYPEKDDLLGLLNNSRAHILGLLREASPEDLAQPTPIEQVREFLPTLGDLLSATVTTHEALHLGQISVWREQAGLPLPI